MKCVYCNKIIKVNKHDNLSNDEKGISFNGKMYHGKCMDLFSEQQAEWQVIHQEQAREQLREDDLND